MTPEGLRAKTGGCGAGKMGMAGPMRRPESLSAPPAVSVKHGREAVSDRAGLLLKGSVGQARTGPPIQNNV